jgi:O-antigen/teichoic acid export membrane protein
VTASSTTESMTDAAGSGAPMRETATRGFAWTGGQTIVARLCSFLGFVVLARILGPHDYGIVALANVFVAFLGIFAAAGYSQALVQRRAVDDLDLDTIFWIGLGTSVGLTVLMVAAAWPLADIFHEPQLRPILQLLAPSFIFVALGSTHQAVLQRRLAFRSIAMASMVANVVGTAVGIAMALTGFGVWSLVVQTPLGILLTSLGVVFRSGYHPSLRLSFERFWPLLDLSRHYVGSTIMLFFNVRTDDFLIGSVLGSRLLGVYTIGYRTLLIMLEVLAGTVRQVAFPVFARLQDDTERLRRAYESTTRLCAAAAFPVFLFLVAAAPDVVHVVFGDKWAAAAPVLRILSVVGICQVVSVFNWSLLQAIGQARLVFRISVAGTVTQVIGFVITVRFGIEWVAASFVIRAYLVAPVGLGVAARFLHTTVRRTLAGLAAPLASAAVMAAAVVALESAVGGEPGLPRLALLICVAAVVYLAALRLTAADTLAEAIATARAVTRRGTPVQA